EPSAPVLDSNSDSFSIAPSPAAQAQQDARETQEALNLLRRSSAGNASAQKSWEVLPEARRPVALSHALYAGNEARRQRAMKELPAFDPTGLRGATKDAPRRALVQATVGETQDEVRAAAQKAWLAFARYGGREALEEMAAGLDKNNPLENRRVLD